MTPRRALLFKFSRAARAVLVITTLVTALFAVNVYAGAVSTDTLDGQVWTWGNSSQGQLGNGYRINIPRAIPSDSLGGIGVAAGAEHTLTVRSDGTVWSWGMNNYGQLGFGSTGGSEVNPTLTNMLAATHVAAGYFHSVALRSDGSVWAWGWGGYGQLGNASIANRAGPVQVLGMSNIISIAAGGYHTMALRSDGTVWTWGYGKKGALGTGTLQEVNTIPAQVTGISNVIAIAGGLNHSLAIRGDGTVWSWGDNSEGQLGDGTKTMRTTPVQVLDIAGVTSIAGGWYHSLAVSSNGTVWGWGLGAGGALGTGGLQNTTSPVQAAGISGAVKVAAGHGHSLALLSNGSVWSWGWGSSGQLGDGTMSTSYAPVLVIQQQGTPFPSGADIAAGNQHSAAVRCGGTGSSYVSCIAQASVDSQATCAAVGRWPQSTSEANCSYVAGGDDRYVAATPNDWEIYVYRFINDQFTKVVLATGSGPEVGILPVAPGETLYLVLKTACLPAPVSCGARGTLAAHG